MIDSDRAGVMFTADPATGERQHIVIEGALGLGEVVVSGQATMVESRSATQSNLIDDQRVQDLPMNGRNVVALAGTYAGVTSIRANQDTSDGRQGPIM